MKVLPSLITPYFGRNGPEDEEISTREFSVFSLQFSVFSYQLPLSKLLLEHAVAASQESSLSTDSAENSVATV